MRLERQLASIPVKQRLIDGRMADFSRLSDARYRYQTEMRGRRPEQVKTFIENAARRHAGQSFSSLGHAPGLVMLSPTVEVFFGLDSLSRARRPRAPVDLSLEAPPGDADPEAGKDEIRRRNLNTLTPQRAARFIEKHLPRKARASPPSACASCWRMTCSICWRCWRLIAARPAARRGPCAGGCIRCGPISGPSRSGFRATWKPVG